MSDSYIPTQDGLALTYMQTFSNGISASPATYQLSAADAANIASVVADYAAAYALAVDPNTRRLVGCRCWGGVGRPLGGVVARGDWWWVAIDARA